ncbi:hypothetical protein QOZ95_001964 [Paenibacillus brasilensis]|uniref:Uncharacterized protein n=1 Tax=Paenibacillus brasilensis TaxID=128574 RepID=A0ABU0KWI0_9BACL|nr:hypothetical protein [Paenibacillus brasilensis]MDQ0493802.1 hypothetical protein [Paenibacillus brasilensis]
MLSRMVSVLGILLVAAVICLLEVPYMWKKGLKKELWLFSILLLLGIGISSVKILVWTVPTPLDWITVIYKPFSDFLIHIGLIK